MTGYLHGDYAASFAEFATPRHLPRANGWILVRDIANSSCRDAIGCYPLFACESWSNLRQDLDEIGTQLISLALVTDPFGDYDRALLEQTFDRVVPFKEHFIVDLSGSRRSTTSSHHRYYARRALRTITVTQESDPGGLLDEWIVLYAELVKKHKITGLRAFSRQAFARQLRVPGLCAFRAAIEGETVGMHLWYVQNDIAYSHLEAVNDLGYKVGAAYALYSAALEFFTTVARWADLGAGAGVAEQTRDGLTFFKQGWSSATRTAYFCGRIFDREQYQRLVDSTNTSQSGYFPAYRAGEFS